MRVCTLAEGMGNIVCHNNFNNSIQVFSTDDPNVWEGGYPHGGNYRSYYNGTGELSWTYQNETESDWTGDPFCETRANNKDTHPLMYPFDS